MSRETDSNKPKNIGSIYVNVKKGQNTKGVAAAVKYLKKEEAFLSISLKNEDGEGYVKMTGFFNGFKRDDHDPDLIIRPSQPAKRREEEDEDEEEEAPKKKFKKEAPKKKKEFDPEEDEETEEEEDDEDDSVPKFG